jgi:hypothetical protein
MTGKIKYDHDLSSEIKLKESFSTKGANEKFAGNICN